MSFLVFQRSEGSGSGCHSKMAHLDTEPDFGYLSNADTHVSAGRGNATEESHANSDHKATETETSFVMNGERVDNKIDKCDEKYDAKNKTAGYDAEHSNDNGNTYDISYNPDAVNSADNRSCLSGQEHCYQTNDDIENDNVSTRLHSEKNKRKKNEQNKILVCDDDDDSNNAREEEKIISPDTTYHNELQDNGDVDEEISTGSNEDNIPDRVDKPVTNEFDNEKVRGKPENSRDETNNSEDKIEKIKNIQENHNDSSDCRSSSVNLENIYDKNGNRDAQTESIDVQAENSYRCTENSGKVEVQTENLTLETNSSKYDTDFEEYAASTITEKDVFILRKVASTDNAEDRRENTDTAVLNSSLKDISKYDFKIILDIPDESNKTAGLASHYPAKIDFLDKEQRSKHEENAGTNKEKRPLTNTVTTEGKTVTVDGDVQNVMFTLSDTSLTNYTTGAEYMELTESPEVSVETDERNNGRRDDKTLNYNDKHDNNGVLEIRRTESGWTFVNTDVSILN